MLEYIRRSAESWGVKLLFGIIIIVFVFWGAGSYNDQQTSVVAKVNDQTILYKEYNTARENMFEQMRQTNPNITVDQLKELRFNEQVLNTMIDEIVIDEEARKLNISASPAEIAAEILQVPAFTNDKGQFDSSAYRAVLKSQGMVPAQFEYNIRRQIIQAKLMDIAGLPSQVDEAEAKDMYTYANEQMQIEYVQVESGKFLDSISPTEQEIKENYDKNQETYKLAPRVKIDYLLFTPEALGESITVSDQEIEQYYKSNLERQFMQEEQVKARHILIKAEENASEADDAAAKEKIDAIAAELAGGKDFAELAKEKSEGPTNVNGGDLGWFARGQMVKPFEDAAFALEVGKVSEPVRSSFGYHLILVEERKEAGAKTLDEVKQEIKTMLANDKAADKLNDSLDIALEQVVSGVSLEKVAEEMKLALKKSELFSKDQGQGLYGFTPQALTSLFEMPVGDVTDMPLTVENGYVLATITEKKPAEIEPLDAVRERVVQAIKREKALVKAKEEAEQLLKDAMSSGPTIAQAEKKTSEAFGRQGYIPGLGFDTALAAAAFNTDTGQWLPAPYKVGEGYVIAKVTKRIAPEDKLWETEKEQWLTFIRRGRRGELFDAFKNNLRLMAKIEIVNPDLLK